MKKIIAWVISPFFMILGIIIDNTDVRKTEDMIILWTSALFFGELQIASWIFIVLLIVNLVSK